MTAATSVAAETVVHQGTLDWAATAASGRADMLVLGDSVTVFGGDGWDAGFHTSAAARFGLAGTGLIRPTGGGEGEGYSSYIGGGSGFTSGTSAMQASSRPYAWDGVAFTAGSAAASNLSIGLQSAGPLPTTSAYDWHVYTAGVGDAATLGAFRREGATPYGRVQTINASTVPAGTGPTATTFSFASTSDAGAGEFRLENVRNQSVLYSRLEKPGANGVTVTSWGYGGRSALDFYRDKYLGGFGSASGRQGWLDAVVDGGSGKLNVVIAQGFNDRNETEASVHGISDGASAAAFEDNVASLVSAIRSDWQAVGRDGRDLSFTLVGMYEIADGNTKLRDYADALNQMAMSDPQISFVDLYGVGPAYPEAVALGYSADGLHPTRKGALAYSDLVLAAVVPERVVLAPIAVAGLLLSRRRRSCVL